MTSRTKEEQLLLDEKIARIKKQDEEILRRKKMIEEDKRLAEEQNAVVKLRPSTTNISRERTPALKPSNRELRDFHEFSDDARDVDSTAQRRKQVTSRGNFRGRGGERLRGQGNWKTDGPPPDPRSFLYDDERDTPAMEKEGRGDAWRGRRVEERGSPRTPGRDGYRGGREYQRGGRRGGDSGRRGGVGSRGEEEAWRAERVRIDEARIQRQKSADGNWRREWDCDKTMPIDELQYDLRRPTPSPLSQEQFHQPITPLQSKPITQPQSKPITPLQSIKITPPQSKPITPSLSKPITPLQSKPITPSLSKPITPLQSKPITPPLSKPITPPQSQMYIPPDDHQILRGSARGGRGRGRLDITELELSMEKLNLEQIGLPVNFDLGPTEGFCSGEFKSGQTRSIEVIGNTVKVSIPNSRQRQTMSEPRGRFRSQASYSSQSDEDLPCDRSQRGSRRQQRNHRTPRTPLKNSSNPQVVNNKVSDIQQNLPAQKPPLPPLRSEHTLAQSTEGEESWEDVTTSGTESMSEEPSTPQSSPTKPTKSGTESMREESFTPKSSPTKPTKSGTESMSEESFTPQSRPTKSGTESMSEESFTPKSSPTKPIKSGTESMSEESFTPPPRSTKPKRKGTGRTNSLVFMEPIVAQVFGVCHERSKPLLILDEYLDQLGINSSPDEIASKSVLGIAKLNDQGKSELQIRAEESGQDIGLDFSDSISEIENYIEREHLDKESSTLCYKNDESVMDKSEKDVQIISPSGLETNVDVKEESLQSLEGGIGIETENDSGKNG